MILKDTILNLYYLLTFQDIHSAEVLKGGWYHRVHHCLSGMARWAWPLKPVRRLQPRKQRRLVTATLINANLVMIKKAVKCVRQAKARLCAVILFLQNPSSHWTMVCTHDLKFCAQPYWRGVNFVVVSMFLFTIFTINLHKCSIQKNDLEVAKDNKHCKQLLGLILDRRV